MTLRVNRQNNSIMFTFVTFFKGNTKTAECKDIKYMDCKICKIDFFSKINKYGIIELLNCNKNKQTNSNSNSNFQTQNTIVIKCKLVLNPFL